MPASLYSQQSCSFVNMLGLTPVLAAQNASKLMHHYKRTLNKKCGPQGQSMQVLEAGVSFRQGLGVNRPPRIFDTNYFSVNCTVP